jgi:hypothetical protein
VAIRIAGFGATATIARMPSRPRVRPLLALPLLALALLVPATTAHANAAYDRVATAYAEGGGRLDPCQFTVAQLEAALVGIPPQVANVVPDLRRAMGDAIKTQQRGGCKGRTPGAGAATPTTPAPTTTPQSTTTQPQQPAATPARHHDRKPLLVAAIAIAALLLLALGSWLWARMRGWDPAWTARQRHAWGEAGFRTTTTWSEFTDWLRLGR